MFRLRKEVYFDNNATTKVSPLVSRRMERVLRLNYGNPSSLYQVARDSALILEESRKLIATTIGAKPEEVIFNSCASEGNNNVLKILAQTCYPKKTRIISSPIEHSSVMSTLDHLKKQGVEILFCPVDKYGRIIIKKLEELLNDKVFLVCCMLANNEIGTIQDIKTITAITKKHDIPLMSDCVQALGKIPVNVKDLGVDYATFSAHKIHGPKGAGVIYAKEGSIFAPLVHGGHQEFGFRAGTESLHNIAGFAEASRAVPVMASSMGKMSQIKDYFINELKRIKADIIINSPADRCLPNTVSVVFPGINNSILLGALDYQGIAVSAGSACNTQSNEPSHVLKAIGLSDTQARETIRFSFSDSTTIKDIKYALKSLEAFLNNERATVNMITPGQLNENILLDKNTFILDIRFWYDRKFLKSLSGAHEIPFFSFNKHIHKIPKNKNIYVICQGGFNSPVVAYYLAANGFQRVSFLVGGYVAWKMANQELYERYAGKGVTKLDQEEIR
ncbi:MAG: aminotransferase class V-fold PLP-dependent enzyme [bacterium]|nr:aminotransferase class V-fold PLP-dependent enzyme [bacterium]